jgi:endoglucanase
MADKGHVKKNLRQLITLFVSLSVFVALAPQAMAATRAGHEGSNSSSAGSVSFTSAVYRADENSGKFAVTIQRNDTNGPEVVYYGVTNKSSGAGSNFDKIPNSEIDFAPGQSTASFYVTIHDQGINGPMRTARAYLYGAHPQPAGSPSQAIIDLLQNDPIAAKDPANPLGYPQPPTDGDPLQFVNWYVFAGNSPVGAAAAKYTHSKPVLAAELHKLADTPGSESYRFWMWNQPAQSLAATVEKYLADAELAQPNTTVQLSTYSLVHGFCEKPGPIANRFKGWITQLAHGIGNFRVVLYLEEDSLIATHCLTSAQIKQRMALIAYAVKVLSQDPHVLIYLDAGAPDASIGPALAARMLREADIKDAAGFLVNTTHYDWTTSDVNWGQQVAKLTGGKHFIVQTGNNGRGPLVPKDRVDNGNEDLCNPPGRGTGPLSWETGYKYVDGFLWFNNPGTAANICHGKLFQNSFKPLYAAGLIKDGINKVTGPHFHLLKSKTDM